MGRIAQELWTLRRWRNDCDYKDSIHNLQRKLAEALAKAQEVVDKLT